MGDAAEAVLEGLFDYETGELIDGEAPGFPRRMCDAMGRHPGGIVRRRGMNPNKNGRVRRWLCPGCNKLFMGEFGLQQHRTAKGH